MMSTSFNHLSFHELLSQLAECVSDFGDRCELDETTRATFFQYYLLMHLL